MDKRSITLAALAMLGLGLVLIEGCSRSSELSLLPTPTLRPPPATSSLAWRVAHDVPCAPPCWEGLMPGVSTREEARQALDRLQQDGLITQAECYKPFCSGSDQNETEIELRFQNDGMVETIVGMVPGSQYQDGVLSVQQIIDRFGEPEWVVAMASFYYGGVSQRCDATHRKDLTTLGSGSPVQLLYLDQGAIFEFAAPEEEVGFVCPAMRLAGFYYFAPGTSLTEYKALLSRTFRGRAWDLDLEREVLPWRGFGPGYLARRPPLPTTSLAWDLAYDEPCAPPCWEGITPGMSTLDEVHQVVGQLGLRMQMRSAECDDEYGYCQVAEEAGAETSVKIYLQSDGKAGLISGLLHPIWYEGEELTAQQIVDRLGEPSWVWTQAQNKESPSCACDESHSLSAPMISGDLVLIYLERGATFTFDVPPEDAGCLCPYIKINRFEYFPPAASLNQYADMRSEYPYFSGSKLTKDHLNSWHGFGPGYGGGEEP